MIQYQVWVPSLFINFIFLSRQLLFKMHGQDLKKGFCVKIHLNNLLDSKGNLSFFLYI